MSRKSSRIKKETKAKLSYLFQNQYEEIINGKSVLIEQEIIKGPKGTSFKYFKNEEGKKEKYIGKENEDGTYTYVTIKGDKKKSGTYSLQDLIKEIKKIKVLKFVSDYLSKSKQKGGYSRKTSRKRKPSGKRRTSRKRKTSRRTSRKRKTSRKRSRKRKR